MSNRIGSPRALFACTVFLLSSVFFQLPGHAAPSITDQILQQSSNQVYGTVTEVIQGGGYTYIEVDTGAEKVWAASASFPVKAGDKVSFAKNMPMNNFHSKSLNREFSLIYFVNKLNTDQPAASGAETVTAPPHGQAGAAAAKDTVTGIDKVEGGNTIAEVYTDKRNLEGREVQVRGKVTKFTAGVMGKNWLHIRDSSTQDDLTVTSDSAASVDDIVVVKGKLALDRDFGHGYLYPLIVEDATLKKE